MVYFLLKFNNFIQYIMGRPLYNRYIAIKVATLEGGKCYKCKSARGIDLLQQITLINKPFLMTE
jgi:hypothetical protein